VSKAYGGEPVTRLPLVVARVANALIGWTNDSCISCLYPLAGLATKDIDIIDGVSVALRYCGRAGCRAFIAEMDMSWYADLSSDVRAVAQDARERGITNITISSQAVGRG
jgi:hypothetical protein